MESWDRTADVATPSLLSHVLHNYELLIPKSLIRATSYTRLKARDHCALRCLVGQKAETIYFHFTLEGEGLRAKINDHG